MEASILYIDHKIPVKKAFGEEQLTGSERHILSFKCYFNQGKVTRTLDQTLQWDCYYKLPPATVDCDMGNEEKISNPSPYSKCVFLADFV